MKFKELKPILISDTLDIYINRKKPAIKYEWIGFEDNGEIIYRKVNEFEDGYGDTMFKTFGEYEITELVTDGENPYAVIIIDK